MAERRRVLLDIIETDGPMSVRQAYYRAVVASIVPKTKAGYRRVQNTILDLRRAGIVPYEQVVDNTRWMRKPTTWDSAKDALAATAGLYRQALWSTSEYRVECWVESDSIAGSVYTVTESWDVPLMACRGFSSETFAYNAAEAWRQDRRRLPVILYIGDHDPHGLEIEADLQRKLAHFAHFAPEWRRIGVTWAQILELDLPGTPPKKSYGYPIAVEAEALPPQMLRDLLDDAIREYMDEDQFAALLAAEESERDLLARLVETAGGAA